MPSPDRRAWALLLIGKAEGDEVVLERLLDDFEVPDEVLGFHAQQAVEKRLKAILALHGIAFERTHSIGYLTSLLEANGIEAPPMREALEDLTPWAVSARYEGTAAGALDRRAARTLLSAVRDWSTALLERQV